MNMGYPMFISQMVNKHRWLMHMLYQSEIKRRGNLDIHSAHDCFIAHKGRKQPYNDSFVSYLVPSRLLKVKDQAENHGHRRKGSQPPSLCPIHHR